MDNVHFYFPFFVHLNIDFYNSDLRDCPHYSEKDKTCVDGDGCCFRDKVEIMNRKKATKWYEKYYPNFRFIKS